jgi:hypothetical protein
MNEDSKPIVSTQTKRIASPHATALNGALYG